MDKQRSINFRTHADALEVLRKLEDQWNHVLADTVHFDVLYCNGFYVVCIRNDWSNSVALVESSEDVEDVLEEWS